MARQVEPLDGGLVTSKDPTFLQQGELAECTNAVYRASRTGLFRAPGRSSFGTVTAGQNVYGLAVCQFDNAEQWLVAAASTSYRYSAVADTGTFTDLNTGLTAGSTLQVVQYNNLYYLLNGANANLVMRQGPSTRAHGLQPVVNSPVAATAAGTWSLATTGFFDYWTTETVTATENGATLSLESTFTGSPSTVSVASTGVSVNVSQPNPVANSGATGWKVYRGAKARLNDTVFPAGFLVAELPIGTTTFKDGSLTTLGPNLPVVGNGETFDAGWSATAEFFDIDDGVAVCWGNEATP